MPRSASRSWRERGWLRFDRLGVRPLLFLALGSSAVVPVALLGFDQAERWAGSELAATDRQALGAARAAAGQLSVAMLGYVHAAQTFSAQLAGTGLQPAALGTALEAHVKSHPEFLGAYVADGQGHSLMHMNELTLFTTGIDYSDRAYFQEIVRTKRPAISGVHVGRVTGVLTVQIAAPILDAQGKLVGITCSSANLGAITSRAQQTVLGMQEGRVVLVDSEGRRIADSSAKGPLAPEDVSRLPLFAPTSSGDPELRRGEDDHGIAVRGFAVGLEAPVSSWHVLALTPQSVIDSQARRVERQTLVLGTTLGLAALLIAAMLASWFARPLRALAASAVAVTRGDLELLPAEARRAPREVTQLTRAVRAMIESLRSHARDLERQVAARTADLSRANSEISDALATIQRHERSRDEDLAQARLFQAKLLPELPRGGGMSIAAHYGPLDQVSGDIYDVTTLEDGRIRIFLADATGHGVQASLRTLILKSEYDALKMRAARPNDLLDALNARLVDEFPESDLLCSACCVDVRPGPHGAEVVHANAGGVPLYVLAAHKAPWERYVDGPLLGADHVTWPEPLAFQLERGQLLLIATDGLGEQTNTRRERFDARLVELDLGAVPDAGAALGRLMLEFEHFLDGTAVRDDVTVIVLGCAEGAPGSSARSPLSRSTSGSSARSPLSRS
ncbi:MAG TPA: SpoIIE family protein phosphatase [Polyangiaceae bacterium]|nr:SpoIIE family protein phosphatase [Polyangiaceae bacterium]